MFGWIVLLTLTLICAGCGSQADVEIAADTDRDSQVDFQKDRMGKNSWTPRGGRYSSTITTAICTYKLQTMQMMESMAPLTPHFLEAGLYHMWGGEVHCAENHLQTNIS